MHMHIIFQVYVCDMDRDLQSCLKHNIHNRNEEDIKNIINNWEETPRLFLRIDPTSMLQSAAIEDVEMKDADEGSEGEGENQKEEEEDVEDQVI